MVLTYADVQDAANLPGSYLCASENTRRCVTLFVVVRLTRFDPLYWFWRVARVLMDLCSRGEMSSGYELDHGDGPEWCGAGIGARCTL